MAAFFLTGHIWSERSHHVTRSLGPNRSRLKIKNCLIHRLQATSFTSKRLVLCNGKPWQPTLRQWWLHFSISWNSFKEITLL